MIGYTDYPEPPPGMKPVIANPDWPGYLSRGNWTYANDTRGPYVHQHMASWPDVVVPRRWGQSRMPSLLRFPGWHAIGAGARVWDDGTDPNWPDHTHPFVD